MLVDGVDLVQGSRIREVIIREEKRGTGFPPAPSEGDQFFLSQTYNDGQKNFAPGMYEYVSGAWIQPSPEASLTPYDIAGSCEGKPTADTTLFQCVIPRKVNFSADFNGSVAVAGTAPNATASFTIMKNSTAVGTINFAAAATTATFSGSEVSFYPGQVFKVVVPAAIDATISDILFTFAGNSV